MTKPRADRILFASLVMMLASAAIPLVPWLLLPLALLALALCLWGTTELLIGIHQDSRKTR